MRRKYLKIALIGAALGVLVQMVGDFFTPSYGFAETAGPKAEKKSLFHLLNSMHHGGIRGLHSLAWYKQAEPLIFQAVALTWVARRSELAFRTAILSALLFVAIAQGFDYIKCKRSGVNGNTSNPENVED